MIADDGDAESEEGFVDVALLFVANAKPAKLMKPMLRSLDDPTVRSQACWFGNASLGDLRLDVASTRFAAMSGRIGFVGADARGALARMACVASHRFDRVH